MKLFHPHDNAAERIYHLYASYIIYDTVHSFCIQGKPFIFMPNHMNQVLHQNVVLLHNHVSSIALTEF